MRSRRAQSDTLRAMQTLYPVEGATLPLLLEPGNGVDASPGSLARWAAAHRADIDAWLHRDGALLLRGFRIDDPETFRSVCAAIRPQLMSYAGGDSPRDNVADRVYTSTEFPPELAIGLHNELSYTRAWPERLFFCCLVVAARGGETPIADGRQVLAALDADVRDRFARLGVVYRQHLRDDAVAGPGKSWQQTFETHARTDVERMCAAQGIDLVWTGRGLQTSIETHAVLTHPVTGEACWFNQADLWRAGFDEVKSGEHDDDGARDAPLGCDACYGDGSTIPFSDLEAVRSAYRDAEVVFPWRAGDLLILDNVLALHGRKPFAGDRRVLVAMA